MSNKVKAMSHSIIDVGGKIGLGGVSGRYKGTASTLWKIGGCLIGIGVIGIYVLPEIKRKLGQVKIDEKKKKNELENDKAREVSRLKMEEKDHQCDLDIKKAKEISQVKTDEISRVITIRQDFGLMGKKTVGEQTIDKEPALGEWLQWFDTQFPHAGLLRYSSHQHYSERLSWWLQACHASTSAWDLWCTLFLECACAIYGRTVSFSQFAGCDCRSAGFGKEYL